MAIDFAKPATTDNYSSAFVPNIQANQIALAQMLDSSITTITGTPPTNAKRYNRTSSALEEYNGSVWAPIQFHGLTYNSGNIGIGGSPSRKLQVIGAGGSNIISSTDGTDEALMYASGGAARFGAGAAVPIIFQSFGTERARIDASGNLGIGGTPSGTYKLEVAGGISAASASSPTRVVLQNSFANAANRNWALLASQNSYGDFVIRTSNAQNGDPVGSGTDRFNIDGSGNVGIGTAAPSGKLNVSNGGASGLEFYPTGFNSGAGIQAYNRSGTAYVGLTFDGLQHTFATSGTTRMVLDSSGNFGIGGTPTERFTVQGGAISIRGAGNIGAATGPMFALDQYVAGTGRLLSFGNTTGAAGSFEFYQASSNNSVNRTAMLITSAGLLQLAAGNANGGLQLPNAANSSANVLDWYEELSWTPTALGQTTPGTPGYVTQIGRGLRFGRLVITYVEVAWTTHTGTGNIRIGGFPYAFARTSRELSARPQAPTGLAADLWAAQSVATGSDVTLFGINQNTGANSNRAVAANDSWVLVGIYEV